jgi:hypothetical protein
VSKGKREKEGHKMKVRFEAQDRFFILEDDGISDGLRHRLREQRSGLG